MPCSVLMTVTWAFAMAAPDESVTVPVIEAVSCAKSAAGTQIEDTRRRQHRRRDFIINSLIWKLRRKSTRVSPLKTGPLFCIPLVPYFNKSSNLGLLKRVNSDVGSVNCQVKK